MPKHEPSQSYVCITDPDRESPWHAWLRAADHIWHDLSYPFDMRYDAYLDAIHMAQAAAKVMKPPQRAKPPLFKWAS